MFAGKATAFLFQGCSTVWLATENTYKLYTRLEKFVLDKRFNLLGNFVNYSCKKFCKIGPDGSMAIACSSGQIKTF